MATDKDNTFTYDGHLVFYPYSTTIRGENENQTKIIDSLLESLPKYSDINPTRQEKGFDKIHFEKYCPSENSVHEIDLSSITGLQFIREETTTAEAYYDGELVEVDIPNKHSADIYWQYPDYMFFRGAQKEVQKAQSSIRSALFQQVNIESISFEPDFLLWLFYHSFNSTDNHPTSVLRISNVQLQGSHDLFGAENLVRDSADAARSIPILLGILQNKSITSIEADFNHNGEQIRAQIEQERVLLKASRGVMKSATDISRIIKSIDFMEYIVQSFEEWQQLSPSLKYPPLDFFEDIYNVCKEQGIHVDSPSTEPLKEYAAKRGEEPSDYGFDI